MSKKSVKLFLVGLCLAVMGCTVQPETANKGNGVTETDLSTKASGTLKIQSCQSGAIIANQIMERIKLVNTSTSAVLLTNIKVRFYFTYQGITAYGFACDYSPVGSGNVAGTFYAISPAVPGADAYHEITFKSGAGTLAVGASVELQCRIWKTDWSNIDNSKNYSFNPSTSYSDNSKITAFSGGIIQWGLEPGMSAASVSSVSSASISKSSSSSSSLLTVVMNSSPTGTGFTLHMPVNADYTMNLTQFKASIDRMVPISTWVRLPLQDWTIMGGYNADKTVIWKTDNIEVYKQAVAYAKSKGLKVMSGTGIMGGDQFSVADLKTAWSNQCTYLAQQFPTIDVWQIFNEANVGNFSNFNIEYVDYQHVPLAVSQLPVGYLSTMREFVVIAGGIFKKYNPSTRTCINSGGWPFNQDTYARVKDFFNYFIGAVDFFGPDVYVSDTEINTGNPTTWIKDYVNTYGEVWINETGSSTYGGYESAQATILPMQAQFLYNAGVKTILTYELNDSTAAGSEGFFGLFRLDGTEKPAFGAISNKFIQILTGTTATNTGFNSASYYKIVNRNSVKGLDVSGGSTNDGASVIQWPYFGGPNQQWQIVDVGGGYYKIVNRNSGKGLDVSGGSTNDGASVIQWPYFGGPNQQWQVVDVGGGYYKIVNRNSGKALDVSGASIADGGAVIQWPYSGGNNQQWQILPL